MAASTYNTRNTAVRQWGNTHLAKLHQEAKALGIKSYTGAFYRYLKTRYFQRSGIVNAVGYQMPRHAVFVHKGVGRGYPIESVGSITKTKLAQKLKEKGYNKATIAKQLSQASNLLKGKGRKPKAWFNPIIDRALPILADTLAKENANLIANNIFIH